MTEPSHDSWSASARLILAPQYIAVTLVVVAFLPQSTLAQTKSGDRVGPMEEVIVTARRRSESPHQVPVAIDWFSQQQLQARGIDNLAELPRASTNLQFAATAAVSGSSNAASVYIRGIGQTEFLLANDPGVGVFVDGVYLARNIGAVLDSLEVARIEVIKGPQGALFGKNTIGGAVSFVTRPPAATAARNLTLVVGEDDRIDTRLTVDQPLSSQLLAQVSVQTRRIEGYNKRLLTGQRQGDMDRSNGRIKLRWLANEAITLDLALDFQKVRENSAASVIVADSVAQMNRQVNAPGTLTALYNALVGSTVTLPDGGDAQYDGRYLTFDPNTNFSTGPNGSELDSTGGAVTFNWQPSQTRWQFKSITAYRDMRAEFGRDPDSSPLPVASTINDIQHRQLSQEVQVTSVSGAIDWVAGLYWAREQGRDQTDVVILPALFPAAGLPLGLGGYYDIDNTSAAVFGHLSYPFAPRFNLNLGLRYTEDSKRFRSRQFLTDINQAVLPTQTYRRRFDKTTVLAGVDFRLNDNLFFYASYSEGFKSGGFVARYIMPTPAPATFAPETVKNYELGTKISGSGWTLDATAFHADYQDVQVIRFVGIVPLTDNAAEGRSRGIELSLKANLAERWQLSSGIGYLDAKFRQALAATGIERGSHFAYAPRWTSHLGLEYMFLPGWRCRLDYSWRSAMFIDPTNSPSLRSEALGLWSTRLSYNPSGKGWRFSAYGKNLADEQVIVSGTAAIDSFGATEAHFSRGRELGLEISYQW